MLKRWGSALIFVAGSVVGGLALAFLIVALRPDLIRGPAHDPGPAAPAADRALPAPERATYAAAVQRAAPSVVNIYTERRGPHRGAASLREPVGGYMTAHPPPDKASLGSGEVVG